MRREEYAATLVFMISFSEWDFHYSNTVADFSSMTDSERMHNDFSVTASGRDGMPHRRAPDGFPGAFVILCALSFYMFYKKETYGRNTDAWVYSFVASKVYSCAHFSISQHLDSVLRFMRFFFPVYRHPIGVEI